MATVTLRPNGAGLYNTHDTVGGAGGVNNYQQVDETGAHDGDTSYILAPDSNSQADIYAIEANSIPVDATINSVTVHCVSKGDGAVAPVIYDGTIGASAPQSVTGSYVDYTDTFTVTPSGSVAFTKADIDDLQIGVATAASTTGTRTTQVWVVVDYTDDGGGEDPPDPPPSGPAFYPQFDVITIDADGIRVPAPNETINVYNVTQAASLGTLETDDYGIIEGGSFEDALPGDVVEFTHDTYPGKFRIPLQSTFYGAFTAFETDIATYVLDTEYAVSRSDYVKVYVRDKNRPDTAPVFLGSGRAGEAFAFPYQTNIEQDLELFPLSLTTELSQASPHLEEYNKAEITVPATGGGTGADEFIELTDAPSAYTGHAGKAVRVAETEDGLEFVEDVDDGFLYLGREYSDSSSAAVADNPTDPVTIRVENTVAYTADFDWPANITLDFGHGGSFSVASGQTVTIPKVKGLEPGQRYFSGAGEAILGRNATGGEVDVDWWAPPEASANDNHAVNQARLSIANGGKMYFGDRLYYIDNQEIIENMFVEGVGNDLDGSGYSSTYVGNGTRFVPSNTSSSNFLWYATGFFRNNGISNCAVSVQQSTTAKCLGLLGTGPSLTSGLGFRATNVSFHSYLANANATTALARPLVDIDGSAYWAEIVHVMFDHCTGLAAGDYTNIYHIRSTNTNIIFHACSNTASTGGSIYDLEAAGWVKWTHGDERKGSPSYTLTALADRTVTCNFDASNRLLTATSGVFRNEDTSQEVVKATNIPANTHITDVISPTLARVSAANSDFTGQSVAINRYAKSTSTLGYAVLRVRGSGSTLTYDGGADEAFENFLVYERGQFGGVINITNRLIQAAITIKSGLGMINIRGCDIYSGALKDLPGEWTITSVNTGTETLTLSSAHEFIPGQVVYATTTGSLPGGLSTSTPYYVISTPAPNQVILSASSGGSAVNLTASGSGTNKLINPLGGGSCSINVDGCSVSRFSLVNYLETERPVLWQRRDGSSGLFGHKAWYENHDIDVPVSVLHQPREVPLPITFYDPNPNAAEDASASVTTTIHENSSKTLRRWGQGSLTGAPDMDFGFYDQRNISSGDWDIFANQGDSFLLYANFSNLGIKSSRGILGTDGVYPNGYTSAAVGAVTQSTNKSTGVTLHKAAGRITMHNAALGAGTSVSFTLTNSAIQATDHVNAWIVGGEVIDFTYLVKVVPASGSATFIVKNNSIASASEAVVIAFEVVRTPI